MNKPAILYDSYCKLCNAEIEYYKRKDSLEIFDYIDIINPEFSPESFGLTKSDVHKFFHVISKNGEVLKGVDAFNYIWQELGTFQSLQRLYQFKLGKAVMNIAYNVFVKARPYLPRKNECDNYCEI